MDERIACLFAPLPPLACRGLRLSFFAVLAILIFVVVDTIAHAQEEGPWRVGRFSFSDELGGFRITGVSGTGTRNNPYYIRHIFDSPYSGTLVIRTHPMENVARLPNNNVTHSAIHVQIETINNTNLSWIGFAFELQEIRDKPSTYGDGLSFDQLGRRSGDIYSNRFLDFEDEFEPGDRLVYTNGFVNNQTSATMKFVITDFTPTNLFYLFQKPLVPAS